MRNLWSCGKSLRKERFAEARLKPLIALLMIRTGRFLLFSVENVCLEAECSSIFGWSWRWKRSIFDWISRSREPLGFQTNLLVTALITRILLASPQASSFAWPRDEPCGAVMKPRDSHHRPSAFPASKRTDDRVFRPSLRASIVHV